MKRDNFQMILKFRASMTRGMTVPFREMGSKVKDQIREIYLVQLVNWGIGCLCR